MNFIDNIRQISLVVACDDLSRLRIEEELLVMLVRKPSVSLKIKTEALARIKEINKLQLRVLGAA
jgi:hypothetical protein